MDIRGVTNSGQRASDTAETVTDCSFVVGWLRDQLTDERSHADQSIPRPTAAQFAGTTDQFVLPVQDPTVTALECPAQYALTTPSELPAGSFILSGTVETSHDPGSDNPLSTAEISVYVRFNGPASLEPKADRTILSLDQPSTVTLGVSEPTAVGPPRIQIPETPAGLATGITHLAAAHHNQTPSRSHPRQRDHPPLLTAGKSVSIPDTVAEGIPETGIEFQLPPCVESLFVAAPLAYYLGATVTVGQRDRAVLAAAETDVHYEFDPFPAFQREVAGLLRRVFYLDCLVRRMNPAHDPELLETCSLDRRHVRSLSPAGRLERYLETPIGAIRAAVPEWHLSTHARPSFDNARCLPFLLDRLSLIYLSEGAELDRSELLDRTLSDAYPTRGCAKPSDIVEPNVGDGHVHGWLAPGTPINAFKTTPEAYENRYRYRERERDRLQLSVVLNDAEMETERHAVADIYRAADLPMDVTVSNELTTAELASVFESENDCVHFIGHCEDDGLRCPDGTLSMESLSETRTRTFFLNACGSYEQGLKLIERGAVAGAVTFTNVLDRQAALVGTAFSRLLSHGYSIQRAIQLARRRILMGKDYAVVGDGTYALLPSPVKPIVLEVSEGNDGYDVICDVVTPQSAGDSYRLPCGDELALNGTQREFSVGTDRLIEALEANSLPVVFEGEFHWSEDLAAQLDADFCSGH